MLVVEVNLWPDGSQKYATRLATLTIGNDRTGNEIYGNYVCEVTERLDPEPKRFIVKKFRRSRGPLELVREACMMYHRGRPARTIFESREGAVLFRQTS